jgi:UDP-N-acetylmuramate dehydrogenase
MIASEGVCARLAELPSVNVSTQVLLARLTRFGIGGPADIFVETESAESFMAALAIAHESGLPHVVLGGGTNLIVSDDGYRGIVLRFVAKRILAAGNRVSVDSGAVLQDLVDFSIARGLRGLETLAGIPGWVGGAVYGNAGAYGHSISERIIKVRALSGGKLRIFTNQDCRFRYRESAFKDNKDWIILSTELALDLEDASALRKTADGIMATRNEKFPPTMRCAGSIFKNFLVTDLPPHVVAQVPERVIREGKIPAAWFLEQVGAKGTRVGDIQVASYHANLVYNDGAGAARDLCTLIHDLKHRVRARFGIEVEEEVQYVGIP